MLTDYLVAFGGLGLLGLIGFLYVWFTTTPASKSKRLESSAEDRPHR